MPEPQEVVNPEASTTSEQVVNQDVEETTAEQSTTQEQETPQPQPTPVPEGVKDEGEVDEKGVPYKNRYMEYQRKYSDVYGELNELKSSLPNIIQDAVVKAIPQQNQAPQYSKEELIRFKNTTEDPNHRAWAEMELEKIREKESREFYENRIKQEKQEERFSQEQQMALMEVRRKYPVLFNPDGSWNNDHPLTRKMGELYNSRPTFKNDGLGLLGAADMAFADYVLQQQPHLAQQAKQLKRQVKKLEKTTLVEGSGRSVAPTAKNPLNEAKAKFAQGKGSEEELRSVAKELLRARGMI